MSENTSDGTDTTVEEPDVIEFNGEVDALLAERAGYVLRGLDDRVAEVDAELKIRGYKAKRSGSSTPATPPADTATTPADPPADPSTQEPNVPDNQQPTTPAEPAKEAAKTAAQKRAQAALKGVPKGRRRAPADTV